MALADKRMNEKELLLRLQKGDHKAFDALYDQYKDQLTHNLIAFLKDDTLVEDTLQELFFRLWDRRESIDPNQSVAGYLYRISANLAHDHFRRLSRDQKSLQVFWEIVQLQREIPGVVEQKELDEALNKVLDQLPPQRKKVFMLCKFESKSYQEVADELGISVSAVRDHIVQANKFLKSRYDHPDSKALFAVLLASQLAQGLF